MRTVTTTTTWICDRCGAPMFPRSHDIERCEVSVRYEDRDDRAIDAGGTTTTETIDLCHECTGLLRAFLANSVKEESTK